MYYMCYTGNKPSSQIHPHLPIKASSSHNWPGDRNWKDLLCTNLPWGRGLGYHQEVFFFMHQKSTLPRQNPSGHSFLDITASSLINSTMHWSFVSYKVSFEMLFVNIALALQFILSAKCRTYSYLQPVIQWKSLFLPAISQMWFFCFQNILYP